MARGPEMARVIALGVALAAAALPVQAQTPNAEINRAWAAGYRAAFTCSSLWNGAGKPLSGVMGKRHLAVTRCSPYG